MPETTRPKRTCLFRAPGLPTSRPYAIEPIGESATCLQRKCDNFASIHSQARREPSSAREGSRRTPHVVLGGGRPARRARRGRDSARGPRVRREASRELLAARSDVWAFLAEPHHLS